eukprot:jgi/Botrbrau1/150/Bobra.0022s0135.1
MRGRSAYLHVVLVCTLAVQLEVRPAHADRALPGYEAAHSPVWRRRLTQLDLPPSPPSDPTIDSPPPPPPQPPQVCDDLGTGCANCNAQCFDAFGCPDNPNVPNCEFVGVTCCVNVVLPEACPTGGFTVCLPVTPSPPPPPTEIPSPPPPPTVIPSPPPPPTVIPSPPPPPTVIPSPATTDRNSQPAATTDRNSQPAATADRNSQPAATADRNSQPATTANHDPQPASTYQPPPTADHNSQPAPTADHNSQPTPTSTPTSTDCVLSSTAAASASASPSSPAATPRPSLCWHPWVRGIWNLPSAYLPSASLPEHHQLEDQLLELCLQLLQWVRIRNRQMDAASSGLSTDPGRRNFDF